MTTLTEFLLARIAEDEALAMRSVQVGNKGASLVSFHTLDAPPVLIVHPARVLAECEAKRDVVAHLRVAVRDCERVERMLARGVSDAAEYEFAYSTKLEVAECMARHLAEVYADHPDYDEGWRP